jgi:hypothetical protein
LVTSGGAHQHHLLTICTGCPRDASFTISTLPVPRQARLRLWLWLGLGLINACWRRSILFAELVHAVVCTSIPDVASADLSTRFAHADEVLCALVVSSAWFINGCWRRSILYAGVVHAVVRRPDVAGAEIRSADQLARAVVVTITRFINACWLWLWVWLRLRFWLRLWLRLRLGRGLEASPAPTARVDCRLIDTPSATAATATPAATVTVTIAVTERCRFDVDPRARA